LHLFCTGECGKPQRDLVERLETVERAINGLKLEWEDALERLTKMNARLREREKALKERAEESEPPALSVNREPGTTSGRMLTPHQMELQQSILRRRAGG
jgi:chromosome segregation ATPase